MAESSGSCGKGHMESSQSYSGSGLDYSEDTFESFSEEEEESKPSGLCCSVEDSVGSALSEEQPEVVDSAAIEKVVIGRWIGVMGKWIDVKNKQAAIKQDKSVIKIDAEIPELFAGELDALRSFCTRKISRMQQQQLSSEQANSGKSRRLQQGATVKATETRDWSYSIPDGLMGRIRLRNIRETVKQVTEAQIHESSACPECQKKEAELARIAFLRQKKTLIEGALIQGKLEEQIYSRDVLTLLGEALRSFPKPSEDPRDLWQRLKGQKV